MGGHGYATVRLTGDEMRTEFVCIPRPITRSEHARRRAAALSRRAYARSCGSRASGRSSRSRCSKAIPASPSRRGRRLNGGWYWQALSVATALACGLLIGIERGFKLRGPEAGHARRRRAHLHHARPRRGHRRPARRARPAVRGRRHRRRHASALMVDRLRAASSRPSPTRPAPIAALATVGLGFLAGIGEPGARDRRRRGRRRCSSRCRHELHGFVDRLDEDDVKALARYAVIAGAVLPFLPERPLRAARRVEPAEIVAGGRAGHRLLVPRLCRQPHLRRAQRDHRHRADRRRLQLDRGHPVARAAARQRGARRRRAGRNRAGHRGHVPARARARSAILATRVLLPIRRS